MLEFYKDLIQFVNKLTKIYTRFSILHSDKEQRQFKKLLVNYESTGGRTKQHYQ